MKAVNHSWWIGAIISTVLTLTLTGGPAKDNPGILILIGIINGVFWGWIMGENDPVSIHLINVPSGFWMS